MPPIKFTLLKEEFSIHQLPPTAEVPAAVSVASFYSVTRTDQELSIVAPAAVELTGTKQVAGWACIKILGPLDFGLTGILAGISAVLSEAGVSIFAVSTFDTDYILFKKEVTDQAIEALTAAGYRFLA